MAVPDAKEKWSGQIAAVTIGATQNEGGTRGGTVTLGGQRGIPFLSFDGETPNPPAIALDVLDKEPATGPPPCRKSTATSGPTRRRGPAG